MSEKKWNYTTDIVVVGSGAAAYATAITAKSRGAEVMMVEKGATPGGTTRRSSGGFWIPNNRLQKEKGVQDPKDDAIQYMARYSFPQLYDPNDPRLGLPENEYNLIATYYDTASKMVDFLWDIGAAKSIPATNWKGQPHVDYMDHLPENKGIRGRSLFAMSPEGKQIYGEELILQFKVWTDSHNIPLLLNHRVKRIIKNNKGEVVGVEAITSENKTVTFRAKKAVVFGSGGFTHNHELMLHFQRGPHFGGCAVPTNTGDFALMGSAIGAQLGNMAGAFRTELVLEQALSDPGGVHSVFFILGDSVLEVNRYGSRIMDEKRNYTDRSMVHFVWDPLRAEWTNMLVFMIYDERTATLWQGFPPLPAKGAPGMVTQEGLLQLPPPPAKGASASYVIDGNTLDELAKNIDARLARLKTKIGGFSLDRNFGENLKKTVARFNEFAKTGVDADFHRGEYAYDREWPTFPPTVPGVQWPPEGSKNYTMYPLSSNGPYHAIILGAGTLDTNGGPIINHKAQVIDTENKPIPGLYGAGDCIASPTANAYWGGGSTIGPAMTFGYIAGINATEETAKKI